LRGSTNLVIMLGMMQVSKRIPFDDPSVLNTVRLVYISSNVIIGLLYLYIQVQINKKKGARSASFPPPSRSRQKVA
jgi:hypothetical protein